MRSPALEAFEFGKVPTETIERRTALAWKREDPARFNKRPAIYIVDAL